MRRRPWPAIAAACVVVVGAALVAVGVLLGTVWKAPTTSVVSVAAVDGVPMVVTAPGALGLDGPSVVVRAAGSSQTQPVFVGVGRTSDVEEYLGDVARQVLTGISAEGTAMVRREGTSPSGSDPARSDIWVASLASPGGVSLTWPEQPGSWTLVAATDGGSSAPQSVEFTWQLDPPTSRWPLVVGAGVLLTVAGLVAYLLVRGRSGEVAAP